jgi:hypothetical protein
MGCKDVSEGDLQAFVDGQLGAGGGSHKASLDCQTPGHGCTFLATGRTSFIDTPYASATSTDTSRPAASGRAIWARSTIRTMGQQRGQVVRQLIRQLHRRLVGIH